MTENLSVEALIEIIRQFCSISTKKLILPQALIEKDLGITGDDGAELLAHLEKTFGIKFELSDFDLKQGDVLFNAEGLNLFSTIFTQPKNKAAIKDISITHLHQAIYQALKRKNITAT